MTTSNMTTPAQPTLTRYEFIDSLRGFAFLGVLVHHASSRIPNLNPAVAKVAEQGHEGVELFFLVSALTLFLSLDSRRRSERRPILNFFIRRYFRIAPLFFAGALFYYWFDRAMTGGRGSGGSNLWCILATLTFVNGWSVDWINRLVPGGWSIAVEMNFYLMVPWLFRRLRGVRDSSRLAFATLVGGGVASLAVRWLLRRMSGSDPTANIDLFIWYWLPAQLPIFCLGFSLFFIIRPLLKDHRKHAGLPQPDPRFLLFLAVYLATSATFSEPALFLGHLLFGIAFLLLAWSLALHPTPWLVNPIMRHIGKVSFSAYLSHFAVLDLVGREFEGRFPLFRDFPPIVQLAVLAATATALTVAVSTITYRFIEVPGQEFGRSLIRFLEARESLAGNAGLRLDLVVHPTGERPSSVLHAGEPAGHLQAANDLDQRSHGL